MANQIFQNTEINLKHFNCLLVTKNIWLRVGLEIRNKQSIMVHPTTFVLQFCEGISLKADDLFLLSYVRKTKIKFQTIHFGQIKDQLESKTVK